MGNALEVNAQNWGQEVIRSGMLSVVYFWHEHCPWCVRFNPIFDRITETYRGRVKYAKLNVLATPENKELATGHGVMGTPTLMFFCEGRAIGQTVSYMPEEDLKRTLDEMLERHRRCIVQSSDLRSYIV